jgi:ribonuclease D
MAGPKSPILVTTPEALAPLAERLAASGPVAVDIESNGLFAYKARACVVQLASKGDVVVVDALATPLGPLRGLLGDPRVPKIVHDVAFDARILGECGVSLDNVRDTSLAARMLGRPGTGLAALLQSELGVAIDKRMQQHDWGERPLDRRALTYLAGDVVHLEALAERLWADVDVRGIAREVDEETRYRLAQAASSLSEEDTRPPWLRLKGIEKAPEEELVVLVRIADIREQKARELDVPPYKVLAPDVLFAIAKARPRTMEDLAKVRGATQGRRAQSIASLVLRAVAAAADERLSDDDRARLLRPKAPASVARARRAREQRLTAWRRAQAKARGVDEQVVLPGHCLQDLADLDAPSIEAVSRVPGIGRFRVERDGAALVAALVGTAPAGSGDAAAAAPLETKPGTS